MPRECGDDAQGDRTYLVMSWDKRVGTVWDYSYYMPPPLILLGVV